MTNRSVPCLLAVLLAGTAQAAEPPTWQWAGWGGGGFYYAAAFHPTQAGTVYLGGDVAGVYKSTDGGRSWKMINRGLADYGVFSLACDRTAPETVYAATAGGLCKSTDGGAQWRLLPQTGPRELRLTGEKGKSVRCVAVDPQRGNVVWAASPAGRVYRSNDGGESWQLSYQPATEGDPAGTLRVQFGKVTGDWHGGYWIPFTPPAGLTNDAVQGFGLTFRGDGLLPRDCFLTLKASTGAAYRSRNLRELFGTKTWSEVVLTAADFGLDPEYAKQHPEAVTAYRGPDWSQLNRLDFVCVGPLMNEAPVGRFTRFYYQTAAGPQPVREFAKAPAVATYGNVRVGAAQGGPIHAIAVAERQPELVFAASDDRGVLRSRDGGQSWTALPTPSHAVSVAPAPSDPQVVYAAFGKDGVQRSVDGGETWQNLSAALPANCAVNEVAVSPRDPQAVSLIGSIGWDGAFLSSTNGGTTWTTSSQIRTDLTANPTLPAESSPTAKLSAPRNLAINPQNPQELLIAANWRPCVSRDGGRSWDESVRGADISCVHDLRFSGDRVYAAAMDEGTLVSADRGATWRALWPPRWDRELSGHNWRLAISPGPTGDQIVATCSPWDSVPNRVIVSSDGGQTLQRTTAGLPATNPTANTMWGTGYPRALAADPRQPQTLYLGIDGDPSDGREGGGLFRSTDGGRTWTRSPGQPGGRRVFYGLLVDPTDSQRLYWGASGSGGGVWRSADGGTTWQHVFKSESWVFNLAIAADGTVYCPGRNLWRSSDHGTTWKQVSKFPDNGRQVIGLALDPDNPQRIWCSTVTWDGSSQGGVYETTDGGASWQEITADLPYVKPLILRYDAARHELWAAGVGIYRCSR
ncbi:MAG: hypothetical protein IT204_24150 [Fimbriimonadaceae bacterium]|nr:hypothetical protein [Fimbriimonadaceae bacterium]